MAKKYLDVNQQNELLIKRKMKVVTNDFILEKNNYAKIIYTYGNFFKNEKNVYKNNLSLIEVHKIYLLDLNIQASLFSKIMIIEGIIRTYVARAISLKYGPIGHKKISNYKDQTIYSKKMINKLKKIDKKTILKNEIKNINIYLYRKSLPVWLAVENYELGTLIQLINKIKEIKYDVSKMLGVNSSIFEKALQNLRLYRNIITHSSSIFNTKIQDLRTLKKDFFPYKKLNVEKNDNFSKNGLTPILSIIWFFLGKEQAKKNWNIIKNLINNHCKSKKYIVSKNDLFKGFGISEKIINYFE